MYFILTELFLVVLTFPRLDSGIIMLYCLVVVFLGLNLDQVYVTRGCMVVKLKQALCVCARV